MEDTPHVMLSGKGLIILQFQGIQNTNLLTETSKKVGKNGKKKITLIFLQSITKIMILLL